MYKLLKIIVVVSIPVCTNGGILNSIKRKLNWIFTNYVVDGDAWYYDYNYDDYIDRIERPSREGDDFLLDSDICLGADGKFSKSNCPTPPNCTEEIADPIWGPTKLCINRAPFPWNTDVWYVVAMKCIPAWEGCDSCFCGNGWPVRCRYKGTNRPDIPDDDRTFINCGNPYYIRLIFENFYVSASQTYSPTIPKSSNPSAPPSSSPTASLTSQPTSSPTIQTCMIDNDCKDEGSCLIASCLTGVCEYSFGPGIQKQVEIEIKTDNYPGETSWQVYPNSSSIVVLSGASYTENRTIYTSSEYFPVCSYTFVIKDFYGDGICCKHGNGYYKVLVDGNEVLSGGRFNSEESKIFVVSD